MENIIFVHGALGSSKSWEHIVAHLEGHCNIYIINLPGHGKSVEQMQEHSLKFFADYIANYAEEKGLNDYIIAGYSMGGYIGLYMAANHYKGLQKLYTIATKMKWDETIANKEAMKLDYDILTEKAPQFLTLQQKLHHHHFPTILADTQNILKHIGQNPITAQHLSNIQIPVHIHVGSIDTLVTQEETIEAAKHISNASANVLENQPHIIEKMDGGVVADSIKQFI